MDLLSSFYCIQKFYTSSGLLIVVSSFMSSLSNIQSATILVCAVLDIIKQCPILSSKQYQQT